MIRQADVFTKKINTDEIWSDLSIKIHGFIMSKIDREYGDYLHTQQVRPFSLYTVDMGQYFITRISALDDKAEEMLELFRNIKTIRVFGSEENLEVLKVEYHEPINVPELKSRLSAWKYSLDILTPAMYKSGGVRRHDMNLPKYFESVLLKLEQFEGIVFDREKVKEAFNKLEIQEYNVFTDYISSGSQKVIGMKGTINIKLPNDKEVTDELKLLLAYATYSGIGGMTTQGMGGIILRKVEKLK